MIVQSEERREGAREGEREGEVCGWEGGRSLKGGQETSNPDPLGTEESVLGVLYSGVIMSNGVWDGKIKAFYFRVS